MKEKELKRKRETDGDDDDVLDHAAPDTEKPREGMKSKKLKTRKVDHPTDSIPSKPDGDVEETPLKMSKAQKRKAKEERRKKKLGKKEEKRIAKRARGEAAEREAEHEKAEQTRLPSSEHHDTSLASIAEDVEPFDASGLTEEPHPQSLTLDIPSAPDTQPNGRPSSASASPPPDSTFSHASKVSTSSSSTVPSLTTASTALSSSSPRPDFEHNTTSEKLTLDDRLPSKPVPAHPQIYASSTPDHSNLKQDPAETIAKQQPPASDSPHSSKKAVTIEDTRTPEMSSKSDGGIDEEPAEKKESKEELQKRLQARLTAFRATRKADGPDGNPVRSRAELIEARRQAEARRKQRKKELRKQSKEEEARAKEEEVRAKTEAELALLRGSGSPIGSPGDIFSLSSRRSSPDRASQNFGFGRVAWGDGTHLDKEGSALNPAHKRKGPSDPRTALEAATKKRQRLASLDETKRADIEDKDAWLNAKKKVHGERVRDDTSLLKKALKRKENQKSKSEKKWQERIRGVEKGKEMRQKKREDNLRKRKEEKGKKRKVKRPGFEGTFRVRPKSSKSSLA